MANACANLVDNAIKHAENRVDISLDPTPEGVLLSIRDDGPGLPEASLERLGERFYRPNPGEEGLGLGLASVKAMVSLHGGTLYFSNRADGSSGLVARVSLPSPPPRVS
ncbi:sensor histidine kinase [Achromobacter sp. F4_2707]|uniref:sensor histidine kinase n=1 Tax=Achromobacter sp. F4_2707 TaxID=3114286 RepID=UPI0039C72AC7